MRLRTIYRLALGMAILGGGAMPGRTAVLLAPQDFSGIRAYPNPWRSDRHGAYQMTFDRLPEAAVTTIRIFTISGQLVRTISGTQSATWDLRNDSGQNVASGVYLYLATANGQQKTGKVMVIR